ncbi:glycoside hydrolase family 79 protein [Xylariaceae sp. FL0804]|nr:glycoside hydrolase family 79 protein [Xylariaceae sp. FL0804]
MTLSLSATVPTGAAKPVDPSFAGFGIEPSNLFSFMGQESPNQMTTNLLNNLANYTGQPPHIRLGGNTQDYMLYDADMTEWSWIWNPQATGQGQGQFLSDGMLIGPRYFEAASRLPPGTPLTWGLNMAYNGPDYISRLVTMATQVVTNVTNARLVSFEVGNEPDLWLSNGLRAGPWGGQQYTQEWLARAAPLHQQVLGPHGLPTGFVEAPATASTIGTDFTVEQLAGFGIGAAAPGTSTPYLAAWNQHDYYYYIGVSGYALTLRQLMQLSTTEDQFAAWAQQVRQADATPFPYALREMGIVGPIGMDGVTNVFGTALWTLNFLCYAASLNVSSVQLHMTDNSNASAWQPIPMYGRAPFVRPLYSGVAAFAQAVSAGGRAQVVPAPATQLGAPYADAARAYAVYQSGALDGVVVVNGAVANVSSSSAAPRLAVRLQLPPRQFARQTLHLAYLTGPGADATNGTTWAGVSFETSGDGSPRAVSSSSQGADWYDGDEDGGDDQTVTVAADGSAVFSVRDSEAVVATLGRRVSDPPPGGAFGACAASATTAKSSGSLSSAPCSSSSSSSSASGGRGSVLGGSPASMITATTATPSSQRQSSRGACLAVASLAIVVGVLML